mmetsp:Transcript_8672/g.9662  ORF Transcript_8672/g.9662 Transcript_8672/m.9662 type:complete len:233 (+) Transcript_8672:2-700(+)
MSATSNVVKRKTINIKKEPRVSNISPEKKKKIVLDLTQENEPPKKKQKKTQSASPDIGPFLTYEGLGDLPMLSDSYGSNKSYVDGTQNKKKTPKTTPKKTVKEAGSKLKNNSFDDSGISDFDPNFTPVRPKPSQDKGYNNDKLSNDDIMEDVSNDSEDKDVSSDQKDKANRKKKKDSPESDSSELVTKFNLRKTFGDQDLIESLDSVDSPMTKQNNNIDEVQYDSDGDPQVW